MKTMGTLMIKEAGRGRVESADCQLPTANCAIGRDDDGHHNPSVSLSCAHSRQLVIMGSSCEACVKLS